ncbi:hypothetical protein F5878DRAFT_290483 [Lentinula raphanica]|uniref:Galactose-binding like protein n=1 Tax=Lentinula raphanica TaxID=153919 RepID=A0AA38P408_9AGAR|nr:hypothetical protein F5880DRAFT_1509723 [Lentinula raphanica]KAJ3835869.1 hypothetical protein F5878DRAFT_290483 [Lentinula raphanica]
MAEIQDTPTELVSLISPDTMIKVSSTLDKSVGKKNLIDGSSETCWTSQQGLPQTITLTFPNSSSSTSRGVVPKSLSLTFQGGFVGRTCAVYVRPVLDAALAKEKPDWTLLTYVYPEDVNRRQTFTLPAVSSSSPPPATASHAPTSSTASSSSSPNDADSSIKLENNKDLKQNQAGVGTSALRLTFETSSDFFGRITVYDLELKGYRLGGEAS